MIDKEKQKKLYDTSSSGETPEEEGASKQVAEAPKDDEMTFARWRQGVDATRKASGVPLKPQKEMYEKWLSLKAKPES